MRFFDELGVIVIDQSVWYSKPGDDVSPYEFDYASTYNGLQKFYI